MNAVTKVNFNMCLRGELSVLFASVSFLTLYSFKSWFNILNFLLLMSDRILVKFARYAIKTHIELVTE